MSSEMKKSATEYVTPTPFHLDERDVSSLEKCSAAQPGGLRSAHETGVRLRESGCVWCRHLPSQSQNCYYLRAKLRCSDFFARKKIIGTRLDMRSDFLFAGDNFELVVLSRICASRLVARPSSVKHKFQVIPLIIAMTVPHLANCVDAIFAIPKSMETSSPR